MKRKRDIQPCFLCEKSGNASKCDGGRPCSCCINALTPQMCYGGSRLYSPTPPPTVNKEKPVERPQRAQTTSNANGSSTYKASTPSPNTFNVNTAAAFSQKEKEHHEEDVNSQEYINKYLIQQLKTLQLAQDKLKDEVNELKTQNLQLSNDLQLLRTNQIIRGTDDFQLATNFECPMVIYDLTQNPPKVLTANSMFCNMLGYNMSDVIGAIWSKFIHPDYLERTVQCFLQNMESSGNKNKPIILEQCYKDNNGNLLLTKDSYIILHNNGTPRSVFVNVKPMPYNGKQKNRPPIRIRNIQPKPPQSPTMNFTIPQNNGTTNLPNFPMKQNGELISPSTSPTSRMFFPENFLTRMNIPSTISDNTPNINHNTATAFSDNNNNNNNNNHNHNHNINNNNNNYNNYNNNLNLSSSNLQAVNEYFSNNDGFLENLLSPGPFLNAPSPPMNLPNPPNNNNINNNSNLININNKSIDDNHNTMDVSDMLNDNLYIGDIPEDEIWKEISSSEYWTENSGTKNSEFNDNRVFDFQYDQ